MKHFTSRPSRLARLWTIAFGAIGIGFLPTYLAVPAHADLAPKPQNPFRPSEHPMVGQSGTGPWRPKRRPTRTISKGTGLTAPLRYRQSPKQIDPSAPSAIQVTLVEEGPKNPDSASFRTAEARAAAKKVLDGFNVRLNGLMNDRDQRIAEYREGADEREREAEQREQEAQQRKREAEQRARAALLREQVIEAHEKDGYRIAGPGQRKLDQEQRRADAEQKERDAYQAVLDQHQRETDKWQRAFDARTIAAMKAETEGRISLARQECENRLREIAGDEGERQPERASSEKGAGKAQGTTRLVRTSSGLAFELPAGYQVAEIKANGKCSYTVLLTQKRQ